MKDIKFIIPLPPVTKKNTSRILINRKTGKPFVAPSEAFVKYQRNCFPVVKALGINRPINVKALYYMDTKRKVDLNNLHNALHDVMVHYGMIADDNSSIVASTDGSRVLYDKANPRTEVVITFYDSSP